MSPFGQRRGRGATIFYYTLGDNEAFEFATFFVAVFFRGLGGVPKEKSFSAPQARGGVVGW